MNKKENIKILIVDDETISRKVLIKKMGPLGRCTAVNDGPKALVLIEEARKIKEPFNLVTLDVSMPGMDGRKVLHIIRKKEKKRKIKKKDQVKIIMVTSRMNMAIIKECIRLGCNGYIAKPVNQLQLLETISRLGFTPSGGEKSGNQKTYSRIVGQIIQRFYKGQIKLPALPHLVKEVREKIENEDASIDDLTQIIKKDILISSKLISIANSPLYRGIDKVDNLNAALLRMGIKAAYGLISTLVTRDLFKSDNRQLNRLLEKLWMHSLACACFGKKISQELKSKNEETVFLMGIVHDIGKMLLIKAIMDVDPEESFIERDIQVAVHEIHTTFGAALLKKMRFAEEFVRIAEFHHWNNFSKQDDRELLIIHLSDYLANEIGFGLFSLEEKDQEKLKHLSSLESFKQLHLDKDIVITITKEVEATIRESAPAF